MKPKQISAHALFHKTRNKKIVIFGAGRVLDNVFQKYKEYHFEKYVKYIVDNNPELWGTTRTLGNKQIPIRSAQYLRERINKRIILIIMIKDYEAVVKQLNGYKELKHTHMYLYPKCHYLKEDCWDWIFAKLPLRNMIMFQGEGNNTWENALALYEYMQKHNLIKKYKIIWLCEHPDKFSKSPNVVYINRNIYVGTPSIFDIWRDKYYHYAARYLFYENQIISKKRKDQIAVYLKHGTFMLKKAKGLINIPLDADGAICTSPNYAAFAADQERISKEKLIICGSPRLDFLYKEKNVLRTLKLWEPETKYILWLPTLRQTKDGQRNDMKQMAPLGIPLIKSENEFEMLDKYLDSVDAKLIIKPHPHQDLSVYKIGSYKNIIFIPQDILDEYSFTVHSLMRETDGLISDYSTITFDYMLLDRPMSYTVDDMDDYLIGFATDDPFHYMPGEKLYKCEDMICFFEHVVKGKDIFREQRRQIRDFVHAYQDDKNCERFLKIMSII